MTVTEPIFTKLVPSVHLSIKNSGTEFLENRTHRTVADTRSGRHGHTGGWVEGLMEAVATADFTPHFVKNASKLLNVHEEQTLLQHSTMTPPINLPQKPTAQGSVE
jgi:hypothetical protein